MCLQWVGLLWLVVPSVAAVQCTASGAGSCEPLLPSHWCQENNGIGCSNGPVSYPDHQCRETFCSQPGHTGSLPRSLPTNITVVASPSFNSRNYADFRVQWDMADDEHVTGYRVLIRNEDGSLNDQSCACLNKSTRHVTLRRVYTRVKDWMRVEVQALPYTDSTPRSTTTIPLNPDYCIALASNSHCSSNVTYSLMNASEVQIQTSRNGSQVSVSLSWTHLQRAGLGVVVILSDPNNSSLLGTNCTTPGRQPPCFIVREAAGVTIQPLNPTINYTLHLQGFDATACSGISPTHLLDGCGSHFTCCKNGRSIHSHTSSTTTDPSHSTSHDSHMTSFESSSSDSAPSPTLSPSLISPPQHDSNASHEDFTTTAQQSNEHLVPVICSVVLGVVSVIITLLIFAAFLIRKRLRHTHSSKLSGCQAPPSPLGGVGMRLRYASTGHSPNPLLLQQGACPLLSSSTPSPLPSAEMRVLQFPPSSLLSSPSEVHASLTLSSSNPRTDSPLTTSSSSTTASSLPSTALCSPHELPGAPTVTHPLIPHPSSDSEASVLIIYSPSVSAEEREVILTHLVGGLREYGISSRCHDTACVKSPCQWMEAEIMAAMAVLCVCTPDFRREWTQSPCNGKLPVVGLLKHLIHATVSRGESLGKFATILLQGCDVDCIPSLYLQGEPRRFLVTELEDITKFIHNIPSYCTVP